MKFKENMNCPYCKKTSNIKLKELGMTMNFDLCFGTKISLNKHIKKHHKNKNMVF